MPNSVYKFASKQNGDFPWVDDPEGAYVFRDLDEIKICDTCSKCKIIKPEEAILLLMGVPIDD